MNNKFVTFQLLILFFLATLTFAQKKQAAPFTVGLHYHHGLLFNHSPVRTGIDGPHLADMKGAEASIQWQTLGKRDWHHYYNYPVWGMSLLFFQVDDRFITPKDSTGRNVSWGNGIAWLIHKSLKLVNTDFFELNIRIGAGFGYFSGRYHPTENRGNLWLSAPINASMHFNLQTKYRISDHWQVVLGGTFSHFSNGAIMMPNLGVNFGSANVGVHFTPHPERLIYKKDSTNRNYKKNFIHQSAAFGIKVLPDFGTIYYPTICISAHYGRRLSRRSKVVIGLDGFRDNSILADSANSKKDINRLGVFGAHELLFGKLAFVTGLGYYVYNKISLRDAPFYIKIGLRYNITKHIFASVYLKTHYGQADCFEWTGGYTF